MATRQVTVIPATVNPMTHMVNNSVTRRRVAGYARVSTDSEEQLECLRDFFAYGGSITV